jgi:hypothetical protein
LTKKKATRYATETFLKVDFKIKRANKEEFDETSRIILEQLAIAYMRGFSEGEWTKRK